MIFIRYCPYLSDLQLLSPMQGNLFMIFKYKFYHLQSSIIEERNMYVNSGEDFYRLLAIWNKHGGKSFAYLPLI